MVLTGDVGAWEVTNVSSVSQVGFSMPLPACGPDWDEPLHLSVPLLCSAVVSCSTQGRNAGAVAG